LLAPRPAAAAKKPDTGEYGCHPPPPRSTHTAAGSSTPPSAHMHVACSIIEVENKTQMAPSLTSLIMPTVLSQHGADWVIQLTHFAGLTASYEGASYLHVGFGVLQFGGVWRGTFSIIYWSYCHLLLYIELGPSRRRCIACLGDESPLALRLRLRGSGLRCTQCIAHHPPSLQSYRLK
jgi:hypothetical protein